jgi:hypothetical protein
MSALPARPPGNAARSGSIPLDWVGADDSEALVTKPGHGIPAQALLLAAPLRIEAGT